MKERLACIVKYKKSGPRVLFLSLVLAAVLGACAMVTGVKPVTPDTPELPEAEEQVPEEEQEFLEDVTLYELDGGLTIAFPNDIVDQLIIKPGDESRQGDDRLLLAIYEKRVTRIRRLIGTMRAAAICSVLTAIPRPGMRNISQRTAAGYLPLPPTAHPITCTPLPRMCSSIAATLKITQRRILHPGSSWRTVWASSWMIFLSAMD